MEVIYGYFLCAIAVVATIALIDAVATVIIKNILE